MPPGAGSGALRGPRPRPTTIDVLLTARPSPAYERPARRGVPWYATTLRGRGGGHRAVRAEGSDASRVEPPRWAFPQQRRTSSGASASCRSPPCRPPCGRRYARPSARCPAGSRGRRGGRLRGGGQRHHEPRRDAPGSAPGAARVVRREPGLPPRAAAPRVAHAPAAAGAGAGAAPGRRAVRGGGRRARRLPRRRGAPPDDRRRLGLGGPAPADEDAHAGGDREGARLRARRGRGAPPPGGRGAPAGRARRHPGQPGLAPARCARGPPAALRARDGALPAGRHPAAHARGRPGAQPGRGPRGGRHRGARQRRLPDERGDRRVLILAAALAAVVVALVLWLGHTRRTAAALEERLAAAAGSLESLQQAFARFAPAQVVEDIIAQGVSTRSEKKEVTVLFADLKDFTALAEHLDPDLLVRILNGYFERLSRAITNHRGHVAKFIGDGILALLRELERHPGATHDR